MKQAISLALALLATLGIAFWVFASRAFDHYLETIPDLLEEQGIRLTITKPKLRFVGASSERIEALFVKSLTPLSVEHIVVRLPLLSLIGSPRAEVQASLYTGNLDGAVQYDNFDQKFSGQAQLKSLDLSTHPQLKGLGISSGKLDLNVESLVGDFKGLIRATGEIAIREMEKAKDSTWSGSVIGQPGIIFIPKFSDLSLTSKFSLTLNDFRVSDLLLKCSLGTVKGELRSLRSKSGALKTPTGRFLLSLSQIGQAQIGPLLPVISNGRLSADAASAQILLLESDQGKLKLDYTATG